MRLIRTVLLMFVSLLACGGAFSGQKDEGRGYLGFDRNEYPGDRAMGELRKEFTFAGYWLTPAPGGKRNSWSGKRKVMREVHYGYLLLARGSAGSAVHDEAGAQKDGSADAREAARSARAEGFTSGAIIFLDVEEGGRLTAVYHLYLRTWADEILKLGFRPGVYCSGMVVNEAGGAAIVTAEDIRRNEEPGKFAYWVFNDACPPSPGCVSAAEPPLPASSGVKDAAVWQFVRSPRNKRTAARCSGFAEENCYAAADAWRKWHLDMNVAASANPSFAK